MTVTYKSRDDFKAWFNNYKSLTEINELIMDALQPTINGTMAYRASLAFYIPL
jgi:hypothetical protein